MKLTQTNYQEDEITNDYLIGEDYCLINNFEFKDNDELKSLEFISDKNSSICLYGFLQKHPQNTTSSFFVKILNLKQWSFSESGGIIVQSSRYWYKLLNPSPEYAPTFDLFEQRNCLWKELKPILMNWMKKTCNNNNNTDEQQEEESFNKNDLTLENVLLQLPNVNEDALLAHAQILYEKILQDSDFLLEGSSDENQLIHTPFLNYLLENQFRKKELQKIKITKETALMDGIEISDSDSFDEKESDNSSEEEEESYSESNKRRKYKKRASPTIEKKKSGEEKGKRQQKLMKQVYTTSHKMEEGIPSRDYFLQQEFSPRLLGQLSVKYEPGICHSTCFQCKKKRISCYKERPVCSNCLKEGYECAYPEKMRLSPCVPCSERGGKVCNREKPTCDVCIERNTNCYYFSSDTFLILAEKNINSIKEQDEETAGNTTNFTTWNNEAYSEILKEMNEKIKKYSQKPTTTTTTSSQDDAAAAAKKYSHQKPTIQTKQTTTTLEDISKLEKQVENWKAKVQKQKKERMEIREQLENYLENLD